MPNHLSRSLPLITVRVDGEAAHVVAHAAGQPLMLHLPPQSLHLFGPEGEACPRRVELPA
ncbi:MAG: hypothetical protein ABIX12_06645 [Rubrivivax sp.]